MRSYFLLAVVLACGFLSCQKEPDAEQFIEPACKVDQIIFYGNAPDIDTINITYNGDQVSRVDYPTLYIVPEYANGLVSKRNIYLQGSTDLAAYEAYTYNPDSTVGRVVTYILTPGLDVPYPAYENVFTWSGGKLTRLELNIDTAGNGMAPIVDNQYTYTDDNITQAVQTDFEFQFVKTVNYTYDANLNYYGKNRMLWLTDLVFADFNALTLPFALSANNVVSFYEDDPGSTIAVTYDSTDKEDIKALRFDGAPVSTYRYKCQ